MKDKQLKLTALALGLGVILRAYFTFFKGHNIDEYVSLGFIIHPGIESIYWDNHPPLFYLIGKLISAIFTNTKFAMECFVFLSSCLSMLVLSRIVSFRPEFLGTLIIAIFPTSLATCTLIRPTVLIELLAATNFWVFTTYLKHKNLPNRLKIIGIATAIMLTMTTFVSFIYFFICLGMYIYQKNFKVTNIQLVKYFIGLFTLIGILSMIRWPSLGWLVAEDERSQTFVSALVFLRNIYGYSWIVLISAIFLALNHRNIFLISIMLLILAVNPALGTKAIEPRFVYPLVPIFLTQYIKEIESIKFLKLRYVIIAVTLFFFTWMSVWFLKTKRSGIDEAGAWIKWQNINAVGNSLSPVVYRSLGIDLPVVTHNSEKCPITLAAIVPTHAPSFKDGSYLRLAQNNGFSVLSEKVFSEDSIEPVNVWILQRDCHE